VVISTLDFVPHKNLWGERLSPANQGEYGDLKTLLDKLAGEAQRRGFGLFYNLAPPVPKGGGCTENPRRALFISADGRVSPCVFKGIPAPGASRMVGSDEWECRTLHFGSVADQWLPAIWKSPHYREFRKSFRLQPHPECRECPKRREGLE
jgi:hypothetical protein